METTEFGGNITSRNAKMEGLALAYSKDLTEYHTDPSKWIIPEYIVAHHAKFDLLKLKQTGLNLPIKFEDTLIAAHLIDENDGHGLKHLARKYLGVQPKNYKEVDRTDVEAFSEYAKTDAKYTYLLWTKFQKELKSQDLNRVYELEKKIIPVFHDMEDYGMMVDLQSLEELGKYVSEQRLEKQRKVWELAGEEIFIDSTKVLKEFLYDRLKFRCKKLTKKGNLSTDNEALLALNHPLANAILDYREFTKMENSFTNKLPLHLDENNRIHTDYNPLGTVTGRCSSRSPNLQQTSSHSELGKKLRSCFVAPEGKKLIVADFSMQELRVLAHYSNDPLLLNSFKRGDDLHETTAKLIFNRSKISKEERFISKLINFGVIYGISPDGLHKRLQGEKVKISIYDCINFINRYFNTYKKVKDFLDTVSTAVRSRGYVRSITGRRRHLTGETKRELRQAANFTIQGTSADITKISLLNLHKELPKDAHLIGVVHDEVIIECSEEMAESVKTLTIEIMENNDFDLRVPMKVDIKVVDNWSEK